MGISPIVVYSDADRKALHVRLSDEAYNIGDSKPTESYLKIEKIIQAAHKCKADAVHPGYGFLAENPEFVKRCEQEALVFIGPTSEPMEIMGRKTTSRQRMAEAGVPIIPGTLKPVVDENELIRETKEIGFPIMLKASAGGGGKGLRIVCREEDLLSAFQLVQSESLASFNDSSVYIEKYMEESHHIEIQILADNAGRVVFLGERECSVQRRYQKVLEETPSPFVDDELRLEMGRVAVNAAAAVNYRNAGTVEFIVDKHKNFYFM